jgi:hypothetical protein
MIKRRKKMSATTKLRRSRAITKALTVKNKMLQALVSAAAADVIKWKTVAQSWAGDNHADGLTMTVAEFAQIDRDPMLAEVKARLMKETNVRLRHNMGQLLRTVDDLGARRPNQVTASMLTGLARQTSRLRFETNIGHAELDIDTLRDFNIETDDQPKRNRRASDMR